jgi:transposase
MGQMIQDSGWRIPDALWEQMVRLLPPRPRHPLGCHNPRVPDRAAMDGIFFVLRTGSQWGALSATGICSKAHRRFTEEAGVFHEFWRLGLLSYDGGSTGSGCRPTERWLRWVGKKLAPTQPTGASWGPSARWCPWDPHRLRRRTCPITSCLRRRSTPCRSSVRMRSLAEPLLGQGLRL